MYTSRYLACVEPTYGFMVDDRGVVMSCRDEEETGQADCTAYAVHEGNYICQDAKTRLTACASSTVPGMYSDDDGVVRQCKLQNTGSAHDERGCRAHHDECFSKDSSYKGQPALFDTLRCAEPEDGWFHKDAIFEDDGYPDVVDTAVPCVPQAACSQSNNTACLMPFDLFPRTGGDAADFSSAREMKCLTPLAGHWVDNFPYKDSDTSSDATVHNMEWVSLQSVEC